jgi:phosphoribosylformimino-5-aminoimidazole carboxamide ribotide isomerase
VIASDQEKPVKMSPPLLYSSNIRLIPVLDVLNGLVVRGVGGRRAEYRPVTSRLTSSTDPVEVARALVDAFRPRELYLADLDAIRGTPPTVEVYRAIVALGVRLWVDAGVRDADGAKRVAEATCDVVAGLETVPGPESLAEIVGAVGPERVVFSLDLRDGIPLREWRSGSAAILAASTFRPTDLAPGVASVCRQDGRAPRELAAFAMACGITRLIVLDLARVGGGAGTGTDDLCRQIVAEFPQVELIAGGGIADWEDVRRLEACGVRGVLVASALHDGRISPEC